MFSLTANENTSKITMDWPARTQPTAKTHCTKGN